ncbi:hypothetical protein PEX2_085090 [Penicillium expansum]|uniref:Uncharacterized protein n=1 Tax=Penicillium expansum TaxID=27334 RepID=A0A0A2K163_PENEN|nr:hypothetical protein PEX2_085090 [Penicillium expansum]KGO61434.1 hypothetical protein PEX2_085090 [Penicillium expansum]
MEDTRENLHPEGRPVGRRTVLPPTPVKGDEMIVPGPWAIHIHKLPFRVARQGDILQGRYLDAFSAMPNQREPCLRYGIDWTAQEFQQQMNDSLPRVEAALMQVVGQQNELEFRSIDGLSACANCHWTESDTLCQYTQAIPTLDPLTPARNHMNPRQVSLSASTPRDTSRNPFYPLLPSTGATSRPIAPPAQPHGLIKYASEQVWLLNEYSKLVRQLTGLHDKSQCLGAQLEGLEHDLTAANTTTTTTTTEQPIQQTVNDVRASHQELEQKIRRIMMHVINMMEPTPRGPT